MDNGCAPAALCDPAGRRHCYVKGNTALPAPPSRALTGEPLALACGPDTSEQRLTTIYNLKERMRSCFASFVCSTLMLQWFPVPAPQGETDTVHSTYAHPTPRTRSSTTARAPSDRSGLPTIVPTQKLLCGPGPNNHLPPHPETQDNRIPPTVRQPSPSERLPSAAHSSTSTSSPPGDRF